jgi:hypothetical protein
MTLSAFNFFYRMSFNNEYGGSINIVPVNFRFKQIYQFTFQCFLKTRLRLCSLSVRKIRAVQFACLLPCLIPYIFFSSVRQYVVGREKQIYKSLLSFHQRIDIAMESAVAIVDEPSKESLCYSNGIKSACFRLRGMRHIVNGYVISTISLRKK